MSYWPRLILTDEEKEWCVKYYDPNNPKPFVKRRMYPGFLQLTEQQRNPIQSFNIARRSRVFGIDFAGDLPQFKIRLKDVTGEEYTPDAVPPNLLVSGSGFNAMALWYGNTIVNSTALYPFRGALATGRYQNSYIFEPAIILAPNQTLTVEGQESQPPVTVTPDPPLLPETIAPFRLDMTLHVWEFPGMDGGQV